VDNRVIQLIAALNNPRSRARFAALALSATPLEPEPGDRLLLQAGVVRNDPTGATIDPNGLQALLDASRSGAAGSEPALFDRLPKKSAKREQLLRRLVREVFEAPGETISESTLGERLSSHVGDVALFRRALADDGYLERDAAGHSYRAAAETE
jgi:hypothetical protein